MDDRKPDRAVGLRFCLLWILASVLGLNIGYAIGVLLTGSIFREVGSATGGLALGATIGVWTGALQGLVLRSKGPGVPRWILATTLGFGIGHAAVAWAAPASWQYPLWLARGIPVGVSVGVAQGFLLSATRIRFQMWVLLSTLGYAGGYVLGYATPLAFGIQNDEVHPLFVPVVGLVAALVTWVELRKLSGHQEAIGE